MILYHGTAKHLVPKILREGLTLQPENVLTRNPGLHFSDKNVKERLQMEGISLTNSIPTARGFGQAILEINLPSTWPLDLVDRWGLEKDYASLKEIPAKYIRVYEIQPKAPKEYR